MRAHVILAFVCARLFSSTVNLIGGGGGADPAYAALVFSSGTVTILAPLPGNAGDDIASVTINSSGNGLIGGVASGMPYVALVNAEGIVAPIALPISANGGSINAVAINSSGLSLIGGQDNVTDAAYAAHVDASGSLTTISMSGSPYNIVSVAINDSGSGIIGGNASNAYVALVDSSGNVRLPTPAPSAGTYLSGSTALAINASGQSLMGAYDFSTGHAYAAFIDPAGNLTSISSLPGGYSGIQSVAINTAGQGIIGGIDASTNTPYAAFVLAPDSLQVLSIPGTSGTVNGVAINDSGEALIGGVSDHAAFAAFVDPLGNLQVLTLLPTHGAINAVAINGDGYGLIGGVDADTSLAYAALIDPTGTLIPLTVASSSIHSVAMPLFFSQNIPTSGLTGNNLSLANYINTYSPSSSVYFLPAVTAGALPQALESVAPTRHAFDLFIADNNLFFLNNNFSQHIEDTRHYWIFQDYYCRQIDDVLANDEQSRCLCALAQRPNQLWLTWLGVQSHQKAQQQTPAFQPWTTGVIAGFDAHSSAISTYGVGVAYTYTYEHQKEGAGYSEIDQECLFIYGLWNGKRLYADLAVWGGYFQIHNTRNMKLTAFQFKAKSRSKGWQLDPHMEIGCHFDYDSLAFEPFAMIDWVNNWQGAYQETGSSPFNFGQKRNHSSFLRSEVGLKSYSTISFSTWRLVIQEKASYVYRKPFHVGNVVAYLLNTPGAFVVQTLTTPQNIGVVAMKILFEPFLPCKPYGSVAYQGEFGSMYQSNEFSINLGWNF